MKKFVKEFTNRQIAIRAKEKELEAETNLLLHELLNAMTGERQKGLEGFSISEFQSIVKVVSDETLSIIDNDFGDDEANNLAVEDLTQIQQKEIIDFILLNNLVG